MVSRILGLSLRDMCLLNAFEFSAYYYQNELKMYVENLYDAITVLACFDSGYKVPLGET